MFLSEKFVYVDMAKTGTVSVLNWLKGLEVEPTAFRHHLKPSPEIIESDVFKFGTVRDPWSFYRSVWSYGCKHQTKSGVYNSLVGFRPLKSRGFKLNRVGAVRSVGPSIFAALRQDYKKNRELYEDASDPERFNVWLEKIMSPSMAALLSGSYYSSGVYKFSGRYTYLFCRLYSRNAEVLHRGDIKTFDMLSEWHRRSCYIDAFLHSHSLTDDFRTVMVEQGFASEADVARVQTEVGTLNVSASPKRPLKDFYTPRTSALVAERERLMIDKFGYKAPL